MNRPVLSIDRLNVVYSTSRGVSKALRNISLTIPDNSVVGLVGESGSGKSTLALALMGLLPANARMDVASITLDGRDATRSIAGHRGMDLAMVFQDPMSALNPFFKIATQMIEIQQRKFPHVSRQQLRERALAMLKRVGIHAPEQRLDAYPHQLSGGMRQRVIIAMALLVEPRLMIADEPTTALDATVEAEIVELLKDLRTELRGSVILVSHSLGMVATLCDQVIVLYGGVIVEAGKTQAVFEDPGHPYTRALLKCEIDPWDNAGKELELETIPGSVPELIDLPPGCIFCDRCPSASEQCKSPPPLREREGGRTVLCWLA